LKKKIIAYVKDEGSNWNALITTLKSIVNYAAMGMEEKNPLDEKMCKGSKYISIKSM
jgi:hypothetical protein